MKRTLLITGSILAVIVVAGIAVWYFTMQTHIYQVEGGVNGVKVEVLVNGKTVSTLNPAAASVAYDSAVLGSKVKEGANTLELRVYPQQGEVVETKDITYFVVTVKQYEKGEFTGPESGVLLASYTLIELQKQFPSISSESPATIALQFQPGVQVAMAQREEVGETIVEEKTESAAEPEATEENAAERQYKEWVEWSQHWSQEDHESVITSLSDAQLTELNLDTVPQLEAYMFSYQEKFPESTFVVEINEKLVEKYGPCYGIPSGQCRE